MVSRGPLNMSEDLTRTAKRHHPSSPDAQPTVQASPQCGFSSMVPGQAPLMAASAGVPSGGVQYAISQPPTGQVQAAAAAAAAAVYAFPMTMPSHLPGLPAVASTAVTSTATPIVESDRDLSPRSRRKASHNAVEVRRRRRISSQLDRLKAMLNCQKTDKASLLSEAVVRLSFLVQKCHSLETELAALKGEPPPPPLPTTVLPGDDDDEDEEGRKGEPVAMAEQAVAGERQLQHWAQLGEQALQELLVKAQNSQWSHSHARDEIDGFISHVPSPEADGSAPQRLEYCVKAETILPFEPETVAAAYLNLADRQKWHSACSEAKLVEEIWPSTMCAQTTPDHPGPPQTTPDHPRPPRTTPEHPRPTQTNPDQPRPPQTTPDHPGPRKPLFPPHILLLLLPLSTPSAYAPYQWPPTTNRALPRTISCRLFHFPQVHRLFCLP